MSPETGKAAFLDTIDVSRETFAQLEAYHGLLEKWNRRINLVGRRTMADAWRRHFLDSAQLVAHLPATAQVLIDIGSGAGFPGLVLAILRPDLTVHLVDSDQRKCTFLQEAARIAGARVTVHNCRIEQLSAPIPDLITARALAPVAELFRLSAGICGPNTQYLLLKGRDIDVELTVAAKCWNMNDRCFPSMVNSDGFILNASKVMRRSGDGN